MSKLTTKVPITFKSGKEVPIGATVEWKQSGSAVFHFGNENIVSSWKAAIKALDLKVPSVATLKKWSFNGMAKSLMGRTVEPDGFDEFNSPSWLIALGLI